MLVEFIEAVKKLDRCGWDSVLYEYSGSYSSKGQIEPEYYPVIKDLMKLGYTLEGIEGYGGEDLGSDYWGVIKVTKDNESMFVKFHGYYQSHYGVEFYDRYKLCRVKQQPVTTMEWIDE